ncbi:hypothetical protein [Rivularia sp. UHCC 0363]|uniref:hypothetical protein n=1 Tax=Rivularia sp. UHCC 0363 TaxID=3110244 RepID=UPI002B212889|nr:hypothetical protein [Rivularia sp. UHCC 0363]MEA5595662.1 hypothetical protein [Rivularia sp. UHCC 0363]
MNTNPHLQAVVEAPYYENKPLYPWAIADYKPFTFIRLHGKMTDQEIGLVFAQLVDYNNISSEGDANNVLQRVIQAPSLVLPGGIQAKNTTDKVISPSCCCGLEGWREWLIFMKKGTSPWLGHDPNPWVEKVKGLVRVWSDEGNEAFSIDFEQSKFEVELNKVQQDLNAFLARSEEWSLKVGFSSPSKLCAKFDECFNISRWARYRKV